MNTATKQENTINKVTDSREHMKWGPVAVMKKIINEIGSV